MSQNFGYILKEAGIVGAKDKTIHRIADVPPLRPEEAEAVHQRMLGLVIPILAAKSELKLTDEHLAVFCRNTPGGKKGEALWDEFKSRQRKHAETHITYYLFSDFMREVIESEGFPLPS